VPDPADPPRAWILTGSLENFRINAERGFDVIGFKEGRRRLAEQIEPGDEIFFYVTGLQAFGGVARVLGPMFEDRAPVWPQGKKKRPEAYPWRVESEPLLILDEEEFVPAVELVEELEHIGKWPHEHWQLAFQGQLRAVSVKDGETLRDRLTAAAQKPASRERSAGLREGQAVA
jgi:EVE domain